MPNNHQNKYTYKMLLGVSMVTAGIFLAMYILTIPSLQSNWYFWAFTVSIIVNTGLIMLCSAFIHKIKADLIRKQKQHEQHKTFTADKAG